MNLSCNASSTIGGRSHGSPNTFTQPRSSNGAFNRHKASTTRRLVKMHSTVEEAFETAEEAMRLLTSGQRDALIAHLPDDVIDFCIEKKKEKLNAAKESVDLTFTEIIDLCRPNDFKIDSYTMRAFILDTPCPLRPPVVLSTLKLTDTNCKHRYLVTNSTGEQMNLILDMQLQESLQPKYRSIQFTKKWFIKSISGEPAVPIADEPAPVHGPEVIVQAQLDALQAKDAAHVYLFASPQNKVASQDFANFTEMLSTPTYSPLLHHAQSEILKSAQMSRDKCFVLVGVTAQTGDSHVFCWVLGLQSGGDYDGCWMTDAVFLVSGQSFNIIP